jgi:hypothetical protein
MITNPITINGLTINDYTNIRPGNYRNWIQVLNVEGLDMPEVRRQSISLARQDGAIDSERFFGPRLITVTGRIIADSRSALFDLERELKQKVAYPKYDVGSTGSLIYQEESEDFTRLINCKPVGNYRRPEVLGSANKRIWEFQFSLIAEDPYIYRNSLKTVDLYLLSSTGGLIIPTLVPFLIDANIAGGTYLVNNSGNIETVPTVTFYGPGKNPKIHNLTTNKFIQLNYEFLSGDVVVIDMKNKTITLNGSSNLFNYQNIESEFWTLIPGDNQIKFSAELNDPNSRVRLEYRDAFI